MHFDRCCLAPDAQFVFQRTASHFLNFENEKRRRVEGDTKHVDRPLSKATPLNTQYPQRRCRLLHQPPQWRLSTRHEGVVSCSNVKIKLDGSGICF